MAISTVSIDVPGAITIDVTGDSLTAELSDGRTISVPLAWYPRLIHATPEERNNWEIHAEGRHLHWPDLDEDLSIEMLVTGQKSGESRRSFNQWLAAKRSGLPLTIHEIHSEPVEEVDH
ncbi:MAG: DUF2442 domain-containing protein [Alphaproteobacteria bacterium]|nr:DUF2442 domain-containing protein [Alphaproteobacteria bacterium]